MTTCFVQLGRAGDVLNILPMAIATGAAVLTAADYAPIVAGTTAAPRVWRGSLCDWRGAALDAGRWFDRVIVTQLFPGRVERTTSHYCLDEWGRAGMLDKFGKLPLSFPHRSPTRERALFDGLDDGRPMLLLSLTGISGPFAGSEWLRGEIAARWPGFNIVDLPQVRAERFYDLLGLYDRAAGLVTIDTSTLHLCWASNVPAIQLLSYEPEDWHGSVPKGNCVFHCKYREVRDRIGDIHAAIGAWL